MSDSPQMLPDQSLPWAISWAGVTLIAQREGLRLKAYKCPAGIWTIGWGETEGVQPGMVWTKEQADQRLCEEIAKYAAAVKGMCTEYPNDNELAALVSLSYNIGLDGLKTSSVLRLHNAGNAAGAAQAFDLFDEIRDPQTKKLVVSHGLVVRRAQEKALYLTPDPDSIGAMAGVMPQAVAPATPIATSPTVVASTGLTVAGLVGAFKDYIPQAKDVVDQLSSVATTLGVAPVHLIMGAVACGGAFVLYRRLAQRHDGVA